MTFHTGQTVKLAGFIFLIAILSLSCASRNIQKVKPDVITGSIQRPCFNTSFYTLFPGDQLDIICMKDVRKIENYVIQIGDQITITFPSLPEYSNTQPVKPDGTINLPRIHSFIIAGKTMEQVREELLTLYEERDWTPEFYLVVSEYDKASDQFQEILMNSLSSGGRKITVRPDGFINLPAIGEVPVSGKSIAAVTDQIQKKYNSLYPRLLFSAQLTKSEGGRIYIYGEVANPGAYSISSSQSIFELISLAGGLRSSAVTNDIIVMTVDDDEIKCRSIDIKNIGTTEFISNIYLCPGDIVFVPRKKVHSAAELMGLLQKIIFFRGFGSGMNWNFGTSSITTETAP